MDEVREYDIGDEVVLEAYLLASPTEGSIMAGSAILHVKDPLGYTQGDTVLVAGAGAVGGDLVTTVGAVSGSTLTLNAQAETQVTAATVGKPINATTVFTVKKPDGTTSTPSATQLSQGRYRASFLPDQEGDHFYRVGATGAATGAEERRFRVRPKRTA